MSILESTIGKDKLDDILATIKSKTQIDIVVIHLEKGEAEFLSSKLGGYPYWPQNMEYPKDSYGHALVLLAQINLSDFECEKLPKSGLLQFFIAADDVFGYDDEKGYKVVYHESIDPCVTEESVKKAGIRSNIDYEGKEDCFFPVSRCIRLSCKVQKECINAALDGFDEYVKEILTNKYNYDLQGKEYWSFLTDEDVKYLHANDSYDGLHCMFGYPVFAQYDPRKDDRYDTLLFQLDSDYNEEEDLVTIGDAGVMNFFINSNDLKNLNFEDVLYNWDCA